MNIFGPLKKNCPTPDKNKSIVSRILVFVVHKSAVSTVQESNYVGYHNFASECLYLHIYLANIFLGLIEYELIYSLRGAKHRVDYSVHIR